MLSGKLKILSNFCILLIVIGIICIISVLYHSLVPQIIMSKDMTVNNFKDIMYYHNDFKIIKDSKSQIKSLEQYIKSSKDPKYKGLLESFKTYNISNGHKLNNAIKSHLISEFLELRTKSDNSKKYLYLISMGIILFLIMMIGVLMSLIKIFAKSLRSHEEKDLRLYSEGIDYLWKMYNKISFDNPKIEHIYLSTIMDELADPFLMIFSNYQNFYDDSPSHISNLKMRTVDIKNKIHHVLGKIVSDNSEEFCDDLIEKSVEAALTVDLVKYTLQKMNKTQKWLSEQMGVSPKVISNYFTGKKIPDTETLKQMAKLVDLKYETTETYEEPLS